MAYDPLPTDDVDGWMDDYAAKAAELASEADPLERVRLTNEMADLAEQVEDRLQLDIGKVRNNFKRLMLNIDLWLTSAKRELKEAKSLASKYAKRPTQSALLEQIKSKVQRIDALEKSITKESAEYGGSWFGLRGLVTNKIPNESTERFHAARTQVMNEGKMVLVKRQQVISARREAKALTVLTNKAAVNKAAKQDPQAKRSIGQAQQLAADLSAQLEKFLAELHTPKTTSSRPITIETNAQTLEGKATNDEWVNVASNLSTSRSIHANAEATFKLVQTQAAVIANVYATKKRGFNSDELKDALVKAELVKAAAAVTAAKEAVKKYTPVLKRAQKAMAKIEANFKAKAKKR